MADRAPGPQPTASTAPPLADVPMFLQPLGTDNNRADNIRADNIRADNIRADNVRAADRSVAADGLRGDGADSAPLTPIGDGPATVRARKRPTANTGWAREVDWSQVVLLRKEASEVITGESQAYLSENGRPMPAEDRLLMGRSVIRRVVNDHVRALHRDGAALWSPETERNYAQAVEDSVFGYGRMQPLFEIDDAENIEIHGWDSVMVQYGDGRRERLPPVADSDEELVDAIRFLGENASPSRPLGRASRMR